MGDLFLKINAFIKGLILFLRPHILLGFLKKPFLFSYNLLRLTKWISGQKKQGILNDYFTIKRDYQKRYKLYEYLVETQKLSDEAVDYLEFGVSGGFSFKWWRETNKNPNSRFYGFDTFEGLPENWGVVYKKGDMTAGVPVSDDKRVEFVKGLFQDTLPDFLRTHDLAKSRRRIIHLDADLFSATLYALSNMAVHLRPGDILLFDEFNVPNHEFYAYKCFTESFYVKTELLGVVNNYLQAAFKIV